MAEPRRYVLSPAARGQPAPPAARRPAARVRRGRSRPQRWALLVLVSLPVVMFMVPALLGQPVMTGDDVIQNFPLRVLAGWQLRQGHLPLFDPYLWSGAPLLSGWNAGALYPLTFVFAVLPPTAAWTVGMAATWWVAGLGTFAFLRGSRLSAAASFLGALSFAFAGAMTAQFPHFGLVAGLSWLPVALLAALRLSQPAGFRVRLAWLAVLAAAVAMTILAGEPRAIDDVAIVLTGYAGWRAWRLGRWRAGLGYLGAIVAGLTLGAALGAVQWLPGIEAVAGSQRAAGSAALFASGSLPPKWLLLSLVPDLLGGSGSFGEPAFQPAHTLTEVTGYAGLLPLAAAVDLLRRLSWRRLPEWAVWHLLALAGVLLALGANTPLGSLLGHLPLFGGQRLQSRNIVIADFALAVLLAYWADRWLAGPAQRWGPGALARRLAAAAPGVAVIGVVAAACGLGTGMLRWLGAASPGQAGPLRPWLLPSLLLGCLAAALAWWGPRCQPRRRTRLALCFAGADIATFTLLTVASVGPAAGAAATAAGRPGAALVPVRALVHSGRFAVYDPGLLSEQQLRVIGAPDINVMSRTPSVEGYGSLVSARYAAATGSHRASGDGQYVLDPRAAGDGVLDQLGTTVLLTPAHYLIVPAGRGPAPARRAPGLRTLAPGRIATWYLGAAVPVTSVTIPSGGTPGAPGRGIRVRLVQRPGPARWLAARSGGGSLRVSFWPPRHSVAVQVTGSRRRMTLGPPVIGTADGTRYRAAGQLQAALVPPRWRFSGFDGAFAVFRDVLARPALTLRALPHGSLAGAAVHAAGGPPAAPAAARVSSPHGVTVVRSVAGIPGWTAAWHPAGGTAARPLPVRRSGLVQAVTAPPGRGTITWRYQPPGYGPSRWVSLAALAVLAAAAITGLPAARRGRARPGSAARTAAGGEIRPPDAGS